MPLVGLGVWQIPAGRETEQAVAWALEAGYRHVDTAPSVLLIGHNPALQGLAVALAASGEREALARLQAKMPTGALATLQAPVSRWRDLRPGGAELVAFVVPRELV